jgi:hypothetical protein
MRACDRAPPASEPKDRIDKLLQRPVEQLDPEREVVVRPTAWVAIPLALDTVLFWVAWTSVWTDHREKEEGVAGS